MGLSTSTGMYNSLKDEIKHDVLTPEEMKTFKKELNSRTWSHFALSKAETKKFYEKGYHKKLRTFITRKQKRSTKRKRKSKR